MTLTAAQAEIVRRFVAVESIWQIAEIERLRLEIKRLTRIGLRDARIYKRDGQS